MNAKGEAKSLEKMGIEETHSDDASIPLHGPAEFLAMRRAGQLAAATLDHVTPYVVPGVTTGKLDSLCESFIRDHGAVPAPLGYKGYPKATCISPNHVVCHGIPSEKILMDGDIVNIDVTVILDGTGTPAACSPAAIRSRSRRANCWMSVMNASCAALRR